MAERKAAIVRVTKCMFEYVYPYFDNGLDIFNVL